MLFKIKTNASLNQLEDPRQVFDYAYEQQHVILRQVRQGLVEVATSKRQLEQQVERLRARIPKTEAQAQEMIDAGKKEICDLLGRFVYSTEDKTLPEVVAEELKKWKKTICVAESCTGGLLAKTLTDIPGATEYFTQGWVTYSNEAKISQLGVNRKTIEEHGAVSEQVAGEMAHGARKIAGTGKFSGEKQGDIGFSAWGAGG